MTWLIYLCMQTAKALGETARMPRLSGDFPVGLCDKYSTLFTWASSYTRFTETPHPLTPEHSLALRDRLKGPNHSLNKYVNRN